MASVTRMPPPKNGGTRKWRAKIVRRGLPVRTKVFLRREDAEGWARKVESELERGLWREPTPAAAACMTLSGAIERYSREVLPALRSPAVARSNLRMIAASEIASLPLDAIDKHRIRKIATEWGRYLQHASVRRRLVTLAAVFSAAIEDWGLDGLHNPVPGELRPEKNRRSRRVTDAEIDALCAATGSVELAAFIRFAVETAMRRGEICALRWQYVDLNVGGEGVAAGTAHLPSTKSGVPRTVPLSSRAVAILEALPREDRDGRVFSLAPDSVTQAFTRAARRAGLLDLHFHDLRHEAITRLADRVATTLELSAISGHSDPKTLKRYYHPDAAKTARKLG